MGLVNQTLPGLYNGVSQQPDELRLDTQVTEMINCHPSIVEGVQKRQPALIVSTDTTMPADVFIHMYDRGAGDEQYILVVQDGAWKAFDAVTGLAINGMDWVYDSYLNLTTGATAATSFSMVTVGDTTYVVNKTKTVTTDGITSDNGDPNWETNFYYWVKRTTEIRFGENSSETKGYDYYIYKNGGQVATAMGSDSTGIIADLDTNLSSGSGLNFMEDTPDTWLVSGASNTSKELLFYQGDFIASTHDVLDPYTLEVLIPGDIGSSMSISGSDDGSSWVSLYSDGPNYSNQDSKTVTLQSTYKYFLVTKHRTTGYLYSAIDLNATPTSNVDKKGSVLKISDTSGASYSGADSWGNQATESWTGTIAKLQDLPTALGFPGAVIEVSGDDKNSFDNFYVKYDSVYSETFKPGLVNAFDNGTMPKKLERLADGTFSMSTVDWDARKVGDEDTASMPSFVDSTITDVFFYKNRLGFLSGDNIILSETGEYYNFFPTTVTDVLDSDPIDVAVDSNQAVKLAYAVPYNKELLVFGEHQQFILSASKALSPKDVNIQQSTAYTINKDVVPLTLGPNVFFTTDKLNSSIVREYYVVPDTSNNTAANITAHCPSYVPNGLIKLAGSEKHDMLFGITGTDNKIYVYNYYWQGEEKAQSAWHTWEIESDETIFNIEVLESNLMLMVAYPDGTKAFETINLELPTDLTTVSYEDGGDTPVHSNIVLSKWGVPSGSSNVDSNRASLLLRDLRLSMGDNSYYGLRVTRGAVTSTWLNYDESTLAKIGDHKYPVVGNANNLQIELVSHINKGFKLNSLSWRGQLHLKGSRGI